MNLEELMLRLREEQLEAGAWKTEEPEEPRLVAPAPPPDVEPVKKGGFGGGHRGSGRVCFKCGDKELSTMNTSNLCRHCYGTTWTARRRWYREAKAPDLVPRFER